MSSRDELRCFNAVKRGTCTNGPAIARRELEGRVLRALREKFLADLPAFRAFCEGFTEQVNLLRMEETEWRAATTRELERVAKDIQKVIEAILAGVPGAE